MHIILEIVAAVLFADFISGVMHWVEDSYGNPEWPVIGPLVIRPNILHHEEPSAFTKHSWLRSASVLLIPGAIVLAAAWACGMLTWHVMLVVALGVNANQFHKWNHMPAKQKGKFVVLLQKLFILQTPQQHGRHHAKYKDTNYCVITNFVNPVLEEVNFWRRLEGGIAVLFGVSKRPDATVSLKPRRPRNAAIPRLSFNLFRPL